MSLSTARPSLSGVPPKLATLKIDYKRSSYRAARNIYKSAENDLDFAPVRSSAIQCRSLRLTTALSTDSVSLLDENNLPTQSTINVLAAQTEPSMSSTSFAIPRQSTIEADVGLGSFNILYSFQYCFL